MPKYRIIKLINLSPIHVGTGKENYDFSSGGLHSDTLSSAIAALRAQRGQTSDLKNFLDSFTISSAFPFKNDRFFLPKIQGKLDVETVEAEHEIRKKLKKVKYIELDIWKEIAKGEKVIVKDEQINNEFLSLSENNNPNSKAFVAQRVAVPRGDSGKTEPFFFEWKFHSSESGLYCMVNCKNDTLFEEILSLFTELGINGIGTDKNVGGGKFEVEDGEIELPDIEGANYTMLLSLFIPQEHEMHQLDLSNSKFDLILRGGYMAGSNEETFRHLRKKSIYMFNVGSVFKTTEPLTGKVVNLQPEWDDEQMHPVYRSGRPFSLLIKMQNYE